MSDLFAAGGDAAARRTTARGSPIQDDASIVSVGGHNLRARDHLGRSIRRREQQQPPQQNQQQLRPRSLLSPSGQPAPGAAVRRVLNLDNVQEGPFPQQDDSDDDGYDDDYDINANDFGMEDNTDTNGGDTFTIVAPVVQEQPGVTFTLPPNLPPAQTTAIIPPPPQQAAQQATSQAGQPVVQPPIQPAVAVVPPPRQSALVVASLGLEQRVGHTLSTDVEWQSSVKGEAARIKTYRNEILQSRDLVVFAYMRPGATTIQLLHSATTFSLHGGDPELRGSDFAFIGDRVGTRNPAAVLLQPDQPWKWDTKKAVLDPGRLEQFYANPDNATKLWKPADATAEQDAHVPRMLALPPPLIRYCAEAKRTPFALHQYVVQLVTSQGSNDLLQKCQLIMDWCLVASHYDTSPTTSILALTMRAAPADDDTLDDWLQRQLCHTLGPATPPSLPAAATVTTAPTTAAGFSNTVAAAAPTHPGAPTDIWAQVAAQLSQGMVNVAAALQPVPAASTIASSYEEGGKFYDEYQLAILKGFAHTHQISLVPPIWPMFQHTKHMDTHRDNILRKMKQWAMRPEIQVNIDRSLYLSNNSLKEILSLRFNPGGTTAELYSVDSGISILMCRALTTEARTAIRRREHAEERSRNTRTLAEDEAMQNERIITTCPESYDELLRCLGTYCALLHTLFGKRCMFFQHCFLLWEAMNSDYVLERRNHFSALFCRQVVWAIVEEGRSYFSKRMSPDDFSGVNPYDIKYPRSTLHTLEHLIMQQTPIIRGSFPASWEGRGTVSGTRSVGQLTIAPPVPSVQLGSVAPTVVSGISANTGQRSAGGANQRAVQIRSSNVHQAIKAVMEPFITRCNGTLLGPMLERLNITVADLPQIPGRRVCYNFVLGRCSQNGCRNRDGHVNVADLPEDFVTSLLDTLRPSITHFMSVGAPAPRVFAPRRRRREE